MKTPVICLMGPTAAGKTNLSLQLAARFPLEIVSVDSSLVYRGMDIGTGKPSLAQRQQIPHHLIDICEPQETYSGAKFCQDLAACLPKIIARGKIPILVGGTMLYFKLWQKGIAKLPSADPIIRQQLINEAQNLGWTAMHAKLQAIDPESAARIHPHDTQRIQRALEVYYISGKNLASWLSSDPQFSDSENYQIYNWVITPFAREELHARIEKRFHEMLEQGLVDEVAALRARPELSLATPAMRAVGYRQVWEYLDGNLDQQEMINRGIIATRQLAKRQLTWLRSWEDAWWVDSSLDSHVDLVANQLALLLEEYN